jgi:hypothetical protein
VVPWAAIPFQPYLPTPIPAPAATPAPLCRLQDLTELAPDSGGATGNEAVFFTFRNHTTHQCLTGGYPRVSLSQPGLPIISPAHGGFWELHAPPSDLTPGSTARFAVGYSYACDSGRPPPMYEHVAVNLPGGGTFAQTLSGVRPAGSQIPLGISAECGVTVTQLAAQPPPLVYPSDPLAVLSFVIKIPSSVAAGETIVHIATLSNPTSAPVPLQPCRGYLQTLDSTKSGYFSFDLNCAAAHPIPALASESFLMEMPTSGTQVGPHSLCWDLDEGADSRPPVCAVIDVAA